MRVVVCFILLLGSIVFSQDDFVTLSGQPNSPTVEQSGTEILINVRRKCLELVTCPAKDR